MAENKKSFILYCDLIHTVKKMPMLKRGELLTIVLEYVNDENPTVDDIIVDLVFEPIKQQLKRDLRKWENTSETRSEIGRKGGIASGIKRKEQKEANEAITLMTKQKEAKGSKRTDNVTVTVNDNDILKDMFENFRKLYPGTKKGLKTEYDNFKKKHKDYKDVVVKLDGCLKNQIEARKIIKSNDGFLPQWKMLATWINKRAWEEEIAIAEVQQNSKKGIRLSYNEVLNIQLKGVYPDPPDPDIMDKLETVKENDKTYWVYK